MDIRRQAIRRLLRQGSLEDVLEDTRKEAQAVARAFATGLQRHLRDGTAADVKRMRPLRGQERVSFEARDHRTAENFVAETLRPLGFAQHGHEVWTNASTGIAARLWDQGSGSEPPWDIFELHVGRLSPRLRDRFNITAATTFPKFTWSVRDGGQDWNHAPIIEATGHSYGDLDARAVNRHAHKTLDRIAKALPEIGLREADRQVFSRVTVHGDYLTARIYTEANLPDLSTVEHLIDRIV